MKRNLDGIYFRVERDGKFDSICFTDLTDLEMEQVLQERSAEWLRSMCLLLGQTLRTIGEEFDIVS